MPRGVAVQPTPRSGGGHIEVQNAATIMGQREKDVKDLKTDRGHREEVDGHIRVGYDRARTAKRQIPTNPTVPADALLQPQVGTAVGLASSSRVWAELHEQAFRQLGGCPRSTICAKDSSLRTSTIPLSTPVSRRGTAIAFR